MDTGVRVTGGAGIAGFEIAGGFAGDAQVDLIHRSAASGDFGISFFCSADGQTVGLGTGFRTIPPLGLGGVGEVTGGCEVVVCTPTHTVTEPE